MTTTYCKPQGGMWATVQGIGRCWVESVDSEARTALVRVKQAGRTFATIRKVSFDLVDFSR